MNNCVHFGKCSGCDLLDLNYKSSLDLKKEYLEKILAAKKINIIESKKEIYYRQKIQLPFGTKKGKYENILTLGLHSRDYSHIIDLQECKIQDKDLTEISFAIRDFLREEKISAYDPKSLKGILKYLILRKSNLNSTVLICIVTSYNFEFKKEIIFRLVNLLTEKFGKEKIAGVLQNINPKETTMVFGTKFKTLYGNNFFKEKILGSIFHIKIETFVQVNHEVAEEIYKYVKENLENEPTLELFSGIGTLSLYISDKVKNLVSVELNPESIKSSILAMKKNNKINIKFISADANSFLKKNKLAFKNLVLDPPRTGLGKELSENILKLNPKKIIYISCDPISLKKDLEILRKKYILKSIIAFDMFPYTKHIESVSILEI